MFALMDSQGDIQYVGRTKNLDKRLSAHAHSKKTGDLVLAWHTPPLTYCQARGLEQMGIVMYNTLNVKRDTNLFRRNWINGIRPTNPNRRPSMKSAIDYMYNQLTNDYYNFIGS